MRRALVVVAALAVPSLEAAQAIPPGTVQFVQPGTTDDLVHGRWINATECANQATTNVVMQWTASAAMPAGGSYQIYAANQDPASGIECPKQSNPSTGLMASAIGIPITGALQTVTNHVETVQSFLDAVGLASCGVAGDVPIYVCVQERDASGTSIGFAKGMLTLSVAPPGAPTDVSVTPGESGALLISWTAASSFPAAYDFRVVAAAADPSRDPFVHEVTAVLALTTRMSGLVNGVAYAVQVHARSQAGNESVPSAVVTGTPVAPAATRPVLSRLQGSGQGGCGAGDAGPVALLAVTALLARLRPRAR